MATQDSEASWPWASGGSWLAATFGPCLRPIFSLVLGHGVLHECEDVAWCSGICCLRGLRQEWQEWSLNGYVDHRRVRRLLWILVFLIGTLGEKLALPQAKAMSSGTCLQ